jgi:hypothetical protein
VSSFLLHGQYHFIVALHTRMSPGEGAVNNWPVVDRSSETSSDPIDVNKKTLYLTDAIE